MALKQHENLLAVYPEILGRLKTVKGIKAVKEIGELAELLAQGAAKRKAAPLDGAVYVVYGGSTFADEAKNGKFLKSTLHFTFVLARSYTANGKSTLYEVGETLTAIQRAFSGWDAGDEYAVTPFRRIASPSIEYNDGFAFYRHISRGFPLPPVPKPLFSPQGSIKLAYCS